ncbi:MAG: hypothetical protein JSV70_05800 [bacterium]|nr:MAG: hypothetical protein JSV70_05800 [bacterium]
MPLIPRVIAVFMPVFLIFTGCGFNPKDSGGGIPRGVEKGTVECLYAGCHDFTVAPAGFNPDASWAGGRHANPDSSPAFALSSPQFALSEESCTGCHNPVEDGRSDYAYLFTSGPTGTFLGTPARPIVGCEACHGSGMEHYAYSHTGPGDTAPRVVYNPPYDPAFGDTHYLPEGTAYPTFANEFHLLSCGPCHSRDQHAGGASSDNILANQYAEWFGGDGQGFLVDDGHSDSLIVETNQGLMNGTVRGVPCAACHTAEGFVTFFARGVTSWASSQAVIDRLISETGDTDILDPDNLPGSASLPQVSCVTCHPSHEPGNLVRSVSGAVSGTERRANLCMECHNGRGLYAEVGSGWIGIGGLETPRHPQKEVFQGVTDSGNDGLRGFENLPAFLPSFLLVDSGHSGTINIPDGCAGCHYIVVSDADYNELPLKATTGHTFRPRLEKCLDAACHPGGSDLLVVDSGTAVGFTYDPDTTASFPLSSVLFNGTAYPAYFTSGNYDGDETVEGFQGEVRGLLDQLKNRLANTYGAPYDPKTGLFDLTQMGAFSTTVRAAAYNYDFVIGDGSLGYHNPIYVVNLLQASIAVLP